MYKEISSQKVCAGCMACVDSCNKNAIVITNVGGSDQVWNPGTGMNIEPYFLSFTPKGKKRISYASSFGVTRIPTQYADKFKKLLNGPSWGSEPGMAWNWISNLAKHCELYIIFNWNF